MCGLAHRGNMPFHAASMTTCILKTTLIWEMACFATMVTGFSLCSVFPRHSNSCEHANRPFGPAHLFRALFPQSIAQPHVITKKTSNDFTAIMAKFPTITQPCRKDLPIKHDITPHINMTGPPVSERRRSSQRLKIARQEFEHMLELGIIRPSSSSWSSPLHMVVKKAEGWHAHTQRHQAQPISNPTYP